MDYEFLKSLDPKLRLSIKTYGTTTVEMWRYLLDNNLHDKLLRDIIIVNLEVAVNEYHAYECGQLSEVDSIEQRATDALKNSMREYLRNKVNSLDLPDSPHDPKTEKIFELLLTEHVSLIMMLADNHGLLHRLQQIPYELISRQAE